MRETAIFVVWYVYCLCVSDSRAGFGRTRHWLHEWIAIIALCRSVYSVRANDDSVEPHNHRLLVLWGTPLVWEGKVVNTCSHAFSGRGSRGSVAFSHVQVTPVRSYTRVLLWILNWCYACWMFLWFCSVVFHIVGQRATRVGCCGTLWLVFRCMQHISRSPSVKGISLVVYKDLLKSRNECGAAW